MICFQISIWSSCMGHSKAVLVSDPVDLDQVRATKRTYFQGSDVSFVEGVWAVVELSYNARIIFLLYPC